MARLVAFLLIALVALPAPLLAWIPRCLPGSALAELSCPAEPSCPTTTCAPTACSEVADGEEGDCSGPCDDPPCLPRDCQSCMILVQFFSPPAHTSVEPARSEASLQRSLAEYAEARRERPLLPPPK